MSVFKRMFSRAGASERQTANQSAEADYVRLVTAILSGDATAEAELVNRFEAGVYQIILSIVRNPPLAQDLSQDAFITIIKKIRNGDLQQPEKLKSFLIGVAKFHAIGKIRAIRRRGVGEDLKEAEDLPDSASNQLEQLQAAEEFKEMRLVFDGLTARYRELLLRFYVNEESKDAICADLNMSSAQFDGVLHRARKRYRELYLKRKGVENMRGRK